MSGRVERVVEVDHYRRNLIVAVVGGALLLAVALVLLVTAPPSAPAPDFTSAREERMHWVVGFGTWGVLALTLGLLASAGDGDRRWPDRLAALGFTAVWIAVAGALLVLGLERV